MKLTDFVREFLKRPEKHTVVTFTGGMGAQIISAAIYFSMRSEGRSVYADLTYFDQEEHVATAGSAGDCSHWSWQLEPFGLSPASFDKAPDLPKRDVALIVDGPRKLALGFNALRLAEVQRHFAIVAGVEDILPVEFSSGYLCIHVRRGDYVNVASHLLADGEFTELADKFSGLVKHIAVVSDSPIGDDFRAAISARYEQAVFLDNIDAFTSHRVMRNARVLICSNSQFSLIAALLNPRALVILPKQWFGQGDDRAIETPIHEACTFQLMNTMHA